MTDFDEFVRERSARLQRVAYMLTRDHALAEDLLQTALAQSWSAWSRIEGDPEPYVRRVLVNAYNSWWRRRWTSELPTDELPERGAHTPHSDVDDRDELWRALGRLSRQQRTVLVLRYMEDLSEAQIAEAMSISAGSVKSHASKGLANLRMDPTLADTFEFRPVPVETGRLAGVKNRIATRRRSRLVSAAAACALFLAVIGGYAFGSHQQTDPLVAVLDRGGYEIVARGEDTEVTWTPSTMAFAVAATCVTPTLEAALMTVRINGRELPQKIRCRADGEPIVFKDLEGFAIGAPVTVSVEISGSARYQIAIGEVRS